MSQLSQHEAFMRRAIELAERGRWRTAPNPTVGAVLVRDGEVVAEGWHQVCGQAHAEVNCLRDAAEKGINPAECTLYVTVEPCVMCAGALAWSQIGRVVYGAADPKRGYSTYSSRILHPKTEVVGGVMEEECRAIMEEFFKKLRG